MAPNHSIFLSYSSKNEAIVRRFLSAAVEVGIECWFAPDEIKQGEYGEKITQNIKASEAFVIFCSSFSVGNRKKKIPHSPHCLRELKLAEKYGKNIIAFSLDDTLPRSYESEGFEYHLTENYNWIDIASLIETGGYNRIVKELNRLLKEGRLSNESVSGGLEKVRLEKAREHIKEGRFSQARRRLSQGGLRDESSSMTDLLRIVCDIAEKGIARLSKKEVDRFFEELFERAGGSHSAMASYILACLVEDYYGATSTVMPREKRQVRKRIDEAGQRGKLSYDDLVVLRGVPRSYLRFNASWLARRGGSRG